MQSTKKRGDFGEETAAKHLKMRGYKILCRNYHSRFGEIDIVAKKGEYYVFVEVKLRKNNVFGGGAAAVDQIKQAKIIKTAQLYITQHNLYNEPIRFDVVVVTDGERKFGIKREKIEVIENAFSL